jgi:hypothetical protein
MTLPDERKLLLDNDLFFSRLAEACAAEIQESRKINTKYLSNKAYCTLPESDDIDSHH